MTETCAHCGEPCTKTLCRRCADQARRPVSPSRRTIKQRAREVRSTWSDRQYLSRACAGTLPVAFEFPVVAESDLLGDGE